MEQDWDLQAVVRGCNTNTNINITTTTITSTTATTMSATSMADRSYFPSLNIKQDDNILPCFPDSFEIRNSIIEEELHQLYKPFFPKSQPLSPQKTHMSNFSDFGGSKDQSLQQYQQLKQSRAGSVATTSTSTATTSSIHSQSTRSKRRKNQQKKVCQVPAEGLSSDVWSWRKYGQKPIKGSPYPRGYYRCSSSKGCLARKQVERNRSDPTMFIITYTAEHNHPVPTHRNSLAGTTRHQKPLTPQPSSPSMAVESNKPLAKPSSCSSTASMEEEVVEQSIKVENREDDGEEENNNNTMEDDEEDEHGSFSDMAVTDDFFEGLDEIAGAVPVGEDCFSADPFPASFSLPWMANSNAAAAAGGS